jgi:hypothetical protein
MSQPSVSALRHGQRGLLDVLTGSSGLISHGLMLAFLLLVSLVTYARVLQIRPLHGDNLSILSWAARSNATSFLWGIPQSYPEWRPLAFLTIGAQHGIVGLASIESYFAFNLVTWAVAAFGIYLFVAHTTGSRASGAFVALALLLDLRAVETLKWITGRQESLTAIFGFSVLAIGLSQCGIQRPRIRLAVLFALLLAASLSKEYGVAFAATLFVGTYIRPVQDSRSLRLVAVASALTYALLRVLIVGGAAGSYCNEMGFFLSSRNVCYADLTLVDRLTQHAYNVGATLVGTLLPGILTGTGAVRVDSGLLPISVGWLCLAIVGWVGAPRRTLVMLCLILANSALSLMIYRERNQTFALMGFYASAGVGLSVLLAWSRTHFAGRVASIGAVTVLFGLLALHIPSVQRVYDQEVRASFDREPCDALKNPDRYDARVVGVIKRKYGMANPDCA